MEVKVSGFVLRAEGEESRCVTLECDHWGWGRCCRAADAKSAGGQEKLLSPDKRAVSVGARAPCPSHWNRQRFTGTIEDLYCYLQFTISRSLVFSWLSGCVADLCVLTPEGTLKWGLRINGAWERLNQLLWNSLNSPSCSEWQLSFLVSFLTDCPSCY